MKKKSSVFLTIISLISVGCGDRGRQQNKLPSNPICYEGVTFHPTDSLSGPDYITLNLLNYNTAVNGIITSLMLPGIERRDSLFYGYEFWDMTQTSPDTTVLTVNLYYNIGIEVPKDSIPFIVSENIVIETTKNDTIYKFGLGAFRQKQRGTLSRGSNILRVVTLPADTIYLPPCRYNK